LAIKADHPVTSIASTGLLVALLFLMARMYQRAQDDRERAEVTAAQLKDARERELRSAALAERARIARDLHDVLAHSLSGLSLQLESARLLAEREGAGEPLLQTLARSRRLAADGVDEARRAERALQDDANPQIGDMLSFVEDV